MGNLPENAKVYWENKKGPVVFTTIDQEGSPNSIYATCVSMYKDEMVVITNNYFEKTMHNFLVGSKGSVLYISDDGKPIQIKGRIDYFQEGPVFDDMNKWNPEKHPGHGAAALLIEEIYCGAEKLV